MKIHRFFIAESLRGSHSLPERGVVKIEDADLAHQLRHVLRFQVGHRVVLLDNSGFEYHASIAALTSHDVSFEIELRKKAKNAPTFRVNIFMALSKRDSFEMVLEKGTELGVASFTPVLSERSEKKRLNMERSRRIVREAAEQSERATLPEIFDMKTLAELITSAEHIPAGLCALDPRGERFDVQKMLTNAEKNSSEINFCIGPEGGWSEKEIAAFTAAGIPIYSLGQPGGNILRAETAAISAAALILLS